MDNQLSHRHFSQLPPLSLYIHFPWCLKKCPYCDFNSHEVKEAIPEDACRIRLLKNLEDQLDWVAERPIHSVFMGGGTPSLISGKTIGRLLDQIRTTTNLSMEAEITIECNPGTLDQQNLSEWAKAGVNRLSIGVQSFRDEHLQVLGRIHSGNEAQAMIEAAQDTGFENINIDLMYGLPGQSTQNAVSDLERALSFNPSHLSWYQLTIEPNTIFYRHPPSLPADESIWTMQSQGQIYLEAHGYNQYEVSAWSLAHKQCQHNMNYWQFGDYLGLGAGAHGKVTLSDGEVIRSIQPKMPHSWLVADEAPRIHPLDDDDLVKEFLMNALRLRDGFDRALFNERTGLETDRLLAILEPAVEKGLVETDLTVRPTELGFNHLNELLMVAL